MSKMIDLEKLSVLGEEIKLLEGRKLIVEGELEKTKKETNTCKREVDKQIAKDQEELKRRVSLSNKELDKREAELNKRKEDIITREDESKLLVEEWDKLKKEKAKFSDLKKETEKARIEYLDKARLLGLKIEQKKLEKVIPEKKVIKKVVKKVTKKGRKKR